MKQPRDWIVAYDGSGPEPFGFKCLRCGCHDKVTPPMPLKVFLVWAKEFTATHRHCKEKP